jgi:apolipoprotein N-acyltransferase
VAWVALAPLLVALPDAPGWRAARLGYVTGAVSAVGLLYWTALVVVQHGGLPLWVGVLVMLALCLAFSIFPALFGWALGRIAAAHGARGLLAAPFLWVATEYLRALTFFQFPWCLLGYSQIGQPEMVQLAPYTAVYGVSFLVVLASSLLALLALETRPPRRRALAAAIAVLLASTWAQGRWAMGQGVPETGRITVGLVQAGIRQEDKWVPGNAWSNVYRHLDLTRQAAERGARLVVWPESSVPFLFDEEEPLAALLRGTVQRHGLHLYFGNDDRERVADGRGRLWVGAKLLDPAGEVTARYHKMQLVPFGEYVPLQPLFTMGGRVTAKLVQEVSDFTPGTEAVTGAVGGHPVGGFICYEAIFPSLVRRFTAGGAQLLLNITNDAWYGTTSAPHQHLAMAAFRAVENRRYLVRAANTGITAVVDPWGRVHEPTRLFDRTVLVREVAFSDGLTFYSRHGDVFARACAAVAVAAVLGTFAFWRPRRGRPVA